MTVDDAINEWNNPERRYSPEGTIALVAEIQRLRKLIDCPICYGKGYWGDPMEPMGNFGACIICHGAKENE